MANDSKDWQPVGLSINESLFVHMYGKKLAIKCKFALEMYYCGGMV